MQPVYLTVMKKTSPPKLFDARRQMAIEARARAINADDADFLCRIAAETICDRLNATNREFEYAVDVFSPFDCMVKCLEQSSKTQKVERVLTPRTDSAGDGAMLAEDREVLPLGVSSTNLITSTFGLHRTNDLPGILAQINQALVPDGLFSACLPGDRTLNELRASLLEAESMLNDHASLRVDPFIEVRQAGGLLQRAGFALPVVDTDILTLRYDNISGIIRDLRSMGATNALVRHAALSPRRLLEIADRIYKEKFSDSDGRIRASVEIVYLSGWKAHSSQQKPLKPGSALKSLKDVL